MHLCFTNLSAQPHDIDSACALLSNRGDLLIQALPKLCRTILGVTDPLLSILVLTM